MRSVLIAVILGLCFECTALATPPAGPSLLERLVSKHEETRWDAEDAWEDLDDEPRFRLLLAGLRSANADVAWFAADRLDPWRLDLEELRLRARLMAGRPEIYFLSERESKGDILVGLGAPEIPVLLRAFAGLRIEDPEWFRGKSGDYASWDQFQQISAGEWPNEREAQAFREYQDHLASQGVIDFDDILLLALRILAERPAIAAVYQRTYRYLCVDEAQDLNAVQYALIRVVGSQASSVLMVGDPNQAIYGFNGSSHRFMMEDFPADFEVVRRELRQNYRSSKAVIRVANALFPESNEVDKAALEGEARVIALPEETAEADWIATRIQALLESGEHDDIEGRITLQRMVVLARNRFVFAPLQERLKAAGIAYHLRQPSGGASFESEAGKVMDLSIRLAINPLNRLVLNQLCRALGPGFEDVTGVAAGVEILETTFGRAPAEWRAWLDPLIPFIKSLHADVNSFGLAIGELEQSWSDASASLTEATEAGEQALADLRYLREIWRNYAANVARDSRSLAQLRNQMATGEILPHMTGKGLMLAPVHTVKGLEFDIVFLMGMVEGTFPDYRAAKAGGSALKEEKNDAFVAITRAKRLLYLTWPEAKFMPWDPQNRVRQRRSRYLTDIEQLVPGAVQDGLPQRVAEDSPPYRTPPSE